LTKWRTHSYGIAIYLEGGVAIIVKTRVFEYCDNSYQNLSELAQAMGIAVSQIYRVRKGTRHIDQEFIVGAIKAFPDHKLDDLFYLIPESPCLSSMKGRKRFSLDQKPSTVLQV
jgi:hypothetical protein